MFSQSPVSKSGNNKKNNVETQLETEEDRSAIISHFGKMVDSINLNYSSQKLKLDKIAEYVDTANKSDSEIVDKNTAQTSGDNSSIVFLGENSQANVLISYTFWIKGSEFPLKSIQKSRSSINEDLDILELGNHSKKSLETKFQESVDNNLEIIGRQLIPSSRISIKNRNYGFAEERLLIAKMIDPNNQEVYYLLGKLKFIAKEYSHAERNYDIGISLTKDTFYDQNKIDWFFHCKDSLLFKCVIGKANCLEKMQKKDEALDSYESLFTPYSTSKLIAIIDFQCLPIYSLLQNQYLLLKDEKSRIEDFLKFKSWCKVNKIQINY